MNVIEATRKWLRSCPLIDQENRFNAGYLGARTAEYSVATGAVGHKEDILGCDLCTYSVVFSARLPFGEAIQANISAADFFSELESWIRAQNRAHSYPDVTGYEVTEVTSSNAGVIIKADANTARYQIQIRINLEEV